MNAMAEAGAHPALVRLPEDRRVNVYEENEKHLSQSLQAFDAAEDEYYAPLTRPIQ